MNNDITLSDAQRQADEWIKTYGVRYFNELTNMAILTEEVGDVLWVLVCMANQTGVDLTEAWRQTIEKKTQRDRTRHKNNEKLQIP